MEHGTIQITLDGKTILAREGQSIVEAARENGISIPTLCDYKSLAPAGTCRVCLVKAGNRYVPGCLTQVSAGLVIENETPEILDLRKSLVEMLFVEGNHLCPLCEKSGNCDLQNLAIQMKMTAPRHPYLFPDRKIDASLPHLVLEHNRCIQCLRCVRGVKSKGGKELFGFVERGTQIRIEVDHSQPEAFTEETAQKAMDICPVGALIKKRTGFKRPIGERKFDSKDPESLK